jgi:serine/threonine protein kinase/Tol biopolymer transport system component
VIGRTLSHYRIEERLGVGGMGEVYRARDEKLGRDVALKVLPSGALADEEARRRFRKEATVLARLSHPHIASLFDFDSEDGIDFLVMELVVGPTLEQELRKGPLPEKEVIRLGAQLARGLVAAHEQGVIHRDLKPSNLQLTSDGLLKILDFGVAHLERGPAAAASGEATATETAAGAVLGSPPYMAPEQLLGKSVDARTDLYAAGACLYELATGKRPYGDKRGPQLTEAILHEAPALPRTANGLISPGVEAVILKCLDKDPGLRYQTAKELLVDLERLGQTITTGSVTDAVGRAPRRGARWLWAAAALLIAAFGTGAWLVRQSAPPRLLEIRPVTSGLDASTMNSPFGSRSWTTDGNRLYFVGMKNGRSALLQVPVTGGEPVEIPVPFEYRKAVFGFATRESAIFMGGAEEAEAATSVSPDGVPLWMIPVASGAPRRIGNLHAIEAALSRDGEWIALRQWSRVLLARKDGTIARVLAELPPYEAIGLSWSPDGRTLRYTARGPGAKGSTSDFWVWELTVDSGVTKALWPGLAGDWSSDGRHYFFRRWDAAARRSDVYVVRERSWLPWPRSHPVRLTLGPLHFGGVGAGPDGRRLYAWGMTQRGELQRVDPKTGRLTPFLGGLSAADVAASADGRWLAWIAFPEGTLWRARADGSARLQLTTPPLAASLPRFSPDGRQIVFVGMGLDERGHSVRLVPVNGGEPEVLAPASPRIESWWDPCWSPDGRSIIASSFFLRHPGLFRIDSRTREITPLRGAERLIQPKCGRHGAILAAEPPAPGSAGRMAARVFWPDRSVVDPVLDIAVAYPNWTRDGRAIIGLNLATRCVERFSLETRRSEILADLTGIPLEGLTPTPWMGLAPDDAPLILRSHDTHELYALDWEAP